MKIYVGNLSYATGEAELTQLFTGLGTVDSVQVIRDRATGRSKGFGFVEMNDDQEANAACQALNQREFDGRRLNVNEAKPMERSGGGGFGAARNGFGGGRQKGEARW
jgi:RNA recognition motif-containing protein